MKVVTLKDVVGGLALLEDRFNRKVSKEMAAAYASIMREEGITKQEWAAAVKESFRRSTFWPSPQELIEFARGATDAMIEADWLLVAGLGSGEKFNPKQLSEPGRDALRSLGGYTWVRDHFHPKMRTDFYKAWRANAARRRMPALAAGGKKEAEDGEEGNPQALSR